MSETELIKAVLRQLAKIESQMIKKDDLAGIIEQLIINEEQIEHIQKKLEELQLSVELKHIENINSDELLLRSIKQSASY